MMDKKGNWDLTPAYDITYSYGTVKEHLTTLNGKGKDFVLQDYFHIAKQNLIKKEKAIKIIKEIIAVLDTLETRAKEIGISNENIEKCLLHITPQLNLLKLEMGQV